MPFYPVMPPDVTPGCAEDAALGLLGQAGVVAVRVADLACPARRGLGRDGRTALTAAGAGRIRSGDLVVWLKPVAVAPAVVRRDGRVQAAGHPADHARLGVAEERLDELCGIPGVIDQIARSAVLGGRVKGAARRAMSPALAIRFTLLMTLIPDADYPEVMETLLGNLVLVPWQRPYRVPTAAVACTWREALGPAPLERLRDMALAGVDGEHRSHDYRAVTVGDLEVGSIDGSLIRVPDTPANRAAFGSAGTADDSSPFPQLRELRISAASTRATFGVTTGPAGAGAARDKGEAEQVLLDKALKDYRYLFTPWRLWVMDRNYPGVPRIKAMLADRHPRADPGQGRHHAAPGRGLPARRVLPGGDLRRRDHADRPGDRVHRHRRRPGRPRAVLPDHRPARPRRLPRPPARAGLPLAVDRLGNLPEGGQVRDQRRRAVHRADAPLGSPALVAQEHAAWVTAVELARAPPAPPRRSPSRPAGDAAPGSRCTPGRSRSPPPAGPSSPPSGPARRPPACPPPSPRRTGTPSWLAWPGAASRSTGTGTATARPRPGRASRRAGRAWPPAPRQPRSASASP